MLFCAVVAGEDIKGLLRPFNVYENVGWNDITDRALDKWREHGTEPTFEGHLRSWGALYREWEELPAIRGKYDLLRQMGFIKDGDGNITVWLYGNAEGHWSSREKPGAHFRDFLPIRGGKRGWRAEACEVDVEADIREAIESFTRRWHLVREEAAKHPGELPFRAARSSALRMTLKAYVERRTSRWVAPDALVIGGEWIDFMEKPGWEAVHRYRKTLARLAERAPHTPLTCLGLHD